MGTKQLKKKVLPLVKNDPWLKPYEEAIEGRYQHAINKIQELTHGEQTLSEFASGYLYFGLHKENGEWVFREWAPNATDIYLVGDFSEWKELPKYRLKRVSETGNWEVKLPAGTLKHEDFYKMKVYWEGGCGERIPAWCQRVVQDETTKIFSAQVWASSICQKTTRKPQMRKAQRPANNPSELLFTDGTANNGILHLHKDSHPAKQDGCP